MQGYTTFHIDVPNDRVDYVELLKTITQNLKGLAQTNDKPISDNTDVKKLKELFLHSNNKTCLNTDISTDTNGMCDDIS